MRSQTIALVVLVLVAMVASQEVITDFKEYQRQKAMYDAQKKVYDEYQALRSVPFLPSTDLVAKKPVEESAPGTAEQLLPNYDGKKIVFRTDGAPSKVEPGNTPQNYFHKGPIPAKKSKPEPPPKPFVVPTGPGGFFSVTGDDGSTITTAPDGAVATAPAPAPAEAPVTTFASAPAPAEALVNTFASAPAPAEAPVNTFASAPAPAPATLSEQTGTRAIPLRPLSPQFLFPPALPHSDFHPGPARSIVEALPAPAPAPAVASAPVFAPAPAPAPVAVAVTARATAPVPAAPVFAFAPAVGALPALAPPPAPAPLALPALGSSGPASGPAPAAVRGYHPAERYGPPSFFA